MKLSGWTRLWIVLPLLAGCEVDNPENTMARRYTQRMAAECERYSANVRPSWDQPTDPAKVQEWVAIVAMSKACLELQADIAAWGTE